MSETYVCSECHHQSSIYTHTVGKGITLALLKFKRASLALGRYDAIHPVNDMDGKPYELTKNERGNWTMLRYHGLVTQDEDAGLGYWLITRRGNAFIKGESIPAKTRVLNNEVLHDREPDGQYWITISELLDDESTPFYRQIEQLERERQPVDQVQSGFGFDVPALVPRRSYH